MNYESWQAFYYGAWQWPWALLVVPFAWGVMRSVGAHATPSDPTARFVRIWASLFLLETMLDPVAGALVKDSAPALQTAVSLFFVLAGDFRVYSLLFVLALGVASLGRGLRLAAAATAVVPVVAWLVNQGIARGLGQVPGQVLWLVHEALFVAVCVVLARWWLPRRGAPAEIGFLRGWLGFVAAYYSLWAAADVLILFGVDAGWLVRCVPNQLYYAFSVPVAERLFRASRMARTSTSHQVDR